MPVTRSNKANENAVADNGNQKAKTNLPLYRHQLTSNVRTALGENRNQKTKTNLPLYKTSEGRAALGEVNSNLVKAAADAARRPDSKIKGPSTFISNLKNVKPKVDSHWKKAGAAPTAKTTNAEPMKTDHLRIMARTERAITRASSSARAAAATVTCSSAKPQSSEIILKRPRLSVHSLVLAIDAEEIKGHSNSARMLSAGVDYNTARVLPDGVDDIDKNDFTNLFLEPDYVKEIYEYLRIQEMKFQLPPQFLKTQKEVTPKMRAVLIDWISEVTFQFHLFAESYYLAVDLVNRYLNICTDTTKKNLQLVGVSAMFTAAKFEEMFPPTLKDFVYITDDTYKPAEIIKMEQKILRTLNFDLSSPLAVHFIRRFSKAADLDQKEHNMCKYFVELATVDYSMTHYLPTHLAAAAVLMTFKLKSPFLTIDKLWPPTMQFYTKYEPSDLLPVIKQMARNVLSAPTAKEQSVFNKYSTRSFDKIAIEPIMNGSVMTGLCDDTVPF